MEDYKIDIILGEGPNAQSLRIDLPPFTLIGATTRAGLISAPMRDRFEVAFRLAFYDTEQLQTIIIRAGKLLGVEVTEDGAHELARRSRGTPRIAVRLLRRTRDVAQVKGEGRIDKETARRSLDLLRIDEVGLDTLGRSLSSSAVGPSVWTHWLLPFQRRRTRSPTWSSPICCRRGSSSALPKAASPPSRPTSI